MPLRRHESILLFYEHLPVYHPQFAKGQPYKSKGHGMKKPGVYKATPTASIDNPGRRYPTSILEFPRETNGGGHRHLYHPTQKPLALFEYLIETYTEPGAIVLDNCIGAGTTALASIATGRHFIGIEKDPVFAACSSERVAAAKAERGQAA
jgi:DNA modification methylase